MKFYLSISKCLWYNKKCENSDEGGSGCSKRRKEIWIIPYPEGTPVQDEERDSRRQET